MRPAFIIVNIFFLVFFGAAMLGSTMASIEIPEEWLFVYAAFSLFLPFCVVRILAFQKKYSADPGLFIETAKIPGEGDPIDLVDVCVPKTLKSVPRSIAFNILSLLQVIGFSVLVSYPIVIMLKKPEEWFYPLSILAISFVSALFWLTKENNKNIFLFCVKWFFPPMWIYTGAKMIKNQQTKTLGSVILVVGLIVSAWLAGVVWEAVTKNLIKLVFLIAIMLSVANATMSSGVGPIPRIKPIN